MPAVESRREDGSEACCSLYVGPENKAVFFLDGVWTFLYLGFLSTYWARIPLISRGDERVSIQIAFESIHRCIYFQNDSHYNHLEFNFSKTHLLLTC